MSDEYKRYLEEIHATRNSPRELIDDSVQDAVGKKPTSMTKLISGEVSEVYDVTVPNQENVIVRIARREHPDFLQEKWAIDRAKAAGVPTPDVLLIRHQEVAGQLLSLSIQRKIEAETLDRISSELSESELRDIIGQAGDILSKIHSSPTHGFGNLDSEGNGEHKSLSALLSEKIDQEPIYQEIGSRWNFDAQVVKQIFKVLQKEAPNVPNIDPKLTHGDYTAKHFMIKNGNIVGILDWGEVTGHSPVYDFARWQFWVKDMPIHWLKEGYNNKSLFNEGFDDLLHLININFGLGILWWYSETNYPKGVEHAKERLVKDLQYFK